jgi:hypothetical protein
MNASIVIMKDGTPCLVYDEPFPHNIKYVAFSREDFQISLVFDIAAPKKVREHKFELPIDPSFAKLLEQKGHIGLSHIEGGKVKKTAIVPVVFTDT